MPTVSELLAERKQQTVPPVAIPTIPQEVPQTELTGASALIDTRKAENRLQKKQEAFSTIFNKPSEDITLSDVLGELIFGTQRETTATRTLPEIGSVETGALGSDLRIAAGLLAAVDPDDQKEIIAATMPGTEFSKDEKGNDIVTFPDGQQAILNKPGISFQDATQMTAQALSFIPAANISSLGKNLLTKVGLAGTAGAATSIGLDVVAEQLGAEEVVSPERAAIAGGIEAAFPVGGRIAGGLRRAAAKQPFDIAAETAKVAERGLEAGERVGIELTGPQTTELASALEKQNFIAQLPAGAKKAQDFLNRQTQQAAKAVDDFMNLIAPSEVVETGAARFRGASKEALEAKKVIRAERTSPLYEQAFEDIVKIDIAPIKEVIDLALADLPKSGEIFKTLSKVKGLLKEADNLKKLHNVKLEIDQMISKFGEGSLGNTTKREVLKIKNALLKQMDEGSDLYRQARETFERESPAVTLLEDSIIGKVAAIDDTQLKSIARRIFDPAETNLAIIRNAKKVIDETDPGAWNDLLRVEIERRAGSVAADAVNPPKALRKAIFGNEKSKKILLEGMDETQKKNALWLDEALRRASLGRVPGSQTAAREEIKKELKGGLIEAFRSFIGSPLRAIAGIGEEAAFNRNVRVMAEAIFNPKYAADINKLRLIKDPKSPTAFNAFVQAMTRIDKDLQEEE